MAIRSRFQLVNRGRKGRPMWTVVDEANDDAYVFSNRRKVIAEGYLRILRRAERITPADVKAASDAVRRETER